MIKLTELREQTGEPITQLLHEAVATYYRILIEGEHMPSESCQGSTS
ncbi:MAG: hypothetical protein HYV60_02595 [Planctomycetia bacterium]|nr:hypothetical protein [Planctomycetia bacterium]